MFKKSFWFWCRNIHHQSLANQTQTRPFQGSSHYNENMAGFNRDSNSDTQLSISKESASRLAYAIEQLLFYRAQLLWQIVSDYKGDRTTTSQAAVDENYLATLYSDKRFPKTLRLNLESDQRLVDKLCKLVAAANDAATKSLESLPATIQSAVEISAKEQIPALRFGEALEQETLLNQAARLHRVLDEAPNIYGAILADEWFGAADADPIQTCLTKYSVFDTDIDSETTHLQSLVSHQQHLREMVKELSEILGDQQQNPSFEVDCSFQSWNGPLGKPIHGLNL